MNIGRMAAAAAMSAAVLFQASCMSGGRLTEGTEPRPYPYDAEILRTLDVQIFRDGSHIELVSHTTQSLDDFDLWLNERYLRHIDHLPPGGSLKLSLYEFLDEFGEPFRGGGIWSTNLPEPVVKAEVQTAEGLVGLIPIPERDR
ncbi:MAG: hypothetical protein IT430_13080 [Phycisphaerales bacterium]|nr:hypothetical protein [Phycisphaerales bacterium]